MDTIVEAAKTALIRNVTAELQTQAVTLAVSTCRDDLRQTVQTRVEQLFADQAIQTALEQLDSFMCLTDIEEQTVFKDLRARIVVRARQQQTDIAQFFGRVTQECIDQHHSHSAVGTFIRGAITAAQIAKQYRDMTSFVEKYVQMLREEIVRTSEALPTISAALEASYRATYHTEPPYDKETLLSYLRSAGLFVGDRPYNMQKYAGGPGIRYFWTDSELSDQMNRALPPTFMTGLSKEEMIMKIIRQESIYARQDLMFFANAMHKVFMYAKVRSGGPVQKTIQTLTLEMTTVGTQVLFNKTIHFADNALRGVMETTQGVLRTLHEKVSTTQKEYQERERVEYERIRAEEQAKARAKAEAERVEALKRAEAIRREEQRRRLEADTAYTQTLQRRLQEGEPDHSKTLRTYYQPEALEATHQEPQPKEPVKTQETFSAPDRPTPFPLPNPLGILPVAFAYPVPMTVPTVMPQVVPQALLKKMIPAKEGEGVRVLDTPGGRGQGDPLGGMQRDDSGNRPHVETVDVFPEAHVPQVETFPAGKGPQVTAETFPAPDPSAHGPTVLVMEKKSGDNEQQIHTQKMLEQKLAKAERIGSAQKEDSLHRSATFGTQGSTTIHEFKFVGGDNKNYTLYQREATMNNVPGVFEYLQNESGQITHQRFIENGKVTGTPNQKVERQ